MLYIYTYEYVYIACRHKHPTLANLLHVNGTWVPAGGMTAGSDWKTFTRPASLESHFPNSNIPVI